MAPRKSRGMSPERAKEVADRYFDLGSGDAEEGFELYGAGPTPSPRTRTPKHKAPPPTAAPDPPINDKQARFIEEYCVDWNGTAAAIRAGYSEKTAAVMAYENLRKPHIARAIEARRKLLASMTDWDANAVMRRLAEELTADLADLFNDDGTLKPIKEWPLIWRQGGILVGVDIDEKVDIGADDEGDVSFSNGRVLKVKIANRTKQLDMMGRLALVQAFNHKKANEESSKSTPIDQLRKQLTGAGLRPREIDGTARRVDGT